MCSLLHKLLAVGGTIALKTTIQEFKVWSEALEKEGMVTKDHHMHVETDVPMFVFLRRSRRIP